MYTGKLILLALVVCASGVEEEKRVWKRSIPVDNAWDFGLNPFPTHLPVLGVPSLIHGPIIEVPEVGWTNTWPGVEAKAAVAAAQAAAEGVKRAQQEAEAARVNALHRQQIAAAKESAAALAIKHNEEASSRARAEALWAAGAAVKAAAGAAGAGARVAAAQREAAAREAAAAAALHRIAAHAAAHISKADVDAAKLAAAQRSEAAAAASKVAAARDASVAPLVPGVHPHFKPISFHNPLPIHWS